MILMMKLNTKVVLKDVEVGAGVENWAEPIERYNLGPESNQSISIGAMKVVSD
jgi:hypothetical protein